MSTTTNNSRRITTFIDEDYTDNCKGDTSSLPALPALARPPLVPSSDFLEGDAPAAPPGRSWPMSARRYQGRQGGPLFRPMAPDGSVSSGGTSTADALAAGQEILRSGRDRPPTAGHHGIGIHSLRKTAINDAIRNSATMHEVREFAGHADIRTTEVYFIRKEEDAEVAARKIQIRLTGRKSE